MPPSKLNHSLVDVDVGQEVTESGQEYRCNKSVVLHRVVAGNKLGVSIAKVVAVSTSIAKWNTGQVDVAVAVSSHKVE